MKNTKAGQLFGLIIATLFTAFMIFFIKDTGSSAAIATTFTAIVGTFIGLDIALMIKKTSGMHEGYKEINTQRYIAAIIIFSSLLVETFFISGLYKRNCDSLYTAFGLGFLIVMGGWIGGIEGNKLATESQEPEPAKG